VNTLGRLSIAAVLVMVSASPVFPTPNPPPDPVNIVNRARVLADMQQTGVFLQLNNAGSALVVRTAGVVTFDCEGGLNCSYDTPSGTYTMTGAAAGSASTSTIQNVAGSVSVNGPVTVGNSTLHPIPVKIISPTIVMAYIAGVATPVQLVEGQTIMASSIPVTIASDQTAVPVSGSFTVSNFPALQNVNHTQTSGTNLGAITTYGTSPGAVNVESVNSFVTNTVPVTGTFFQATQPVSCASAATCPVNASQVGGPWTVQGAAAADAAQSGNPVLVGGVDGSGNVQELPIADQGSAPSAQALIIGGIDSAGAAERLNVISGAASTVSISPDTDSLPNTFAGYVVGGASPNVGGLIVLQHVFNGTSWDRMRSSTSTGSLLVGGAITPADSFTNPVDALDVFSLNAGWDATNSKWQRIQVDPGTGTLKVDPGTVPVVVKNPQVTINNSTLHPIPVRMATPLVIMASIGGVLTPVNLVEGQSVMAQSIPVTVASDQSAIPVSGTVNVGNFQGSLLQPCNAVRTTNCRHL
jgi:hypothetical protein